MACLILAKPRAARMLSSGHETRYEAALISPNGAPAAILAYDAKRTKRALFNIMRKHGERIIQLIDMREDEEFIWQRGAWQLPRGFRVGWTGATEFERASEASRVSA